MNATPFERIQVIFEHAACTLLAAAVAFAAYRGLGGLLGEPQLGICAAFSGLAAYLLSSHGLFRRSFELPEYTMADFETAKLELSEPDELVLTERDMLHSQPKTSDPELLELDDILAELGPDSRVVRLFDRSSMPSPGHLKARIDDHLGKGGSPSRVPDASKALSEALAELRRSLS